MEFLAEITLFVIVDSTLLSDPSDKFHQSLQGEWVNCFLDKIIVTCMFEINKQKSHGRFIRHRRI